MEYLCDRDEVAVAEDDDGVQCAYFVDTSTRTGFVKLARCNFATLVVIVAENR